MNSSNQLEEDEMRLMKQNFLKEQILDNPDYDADEFVEFMRTAKTDVEGSDIDNWNFDELVNQVQDFKSMKQQLESRNPNDFKRTNQ
jgi:hypothetical protein